MIMDRIGRRSQPWVVAAAYAVPLCVLPSAIWRVQLVLSGQLRFGQGGWYPLLLSAVSMAAALLTPGLVHRWGEAVPRWVPVIGGRPIPVRAAVVAAAVGAALVTGISLYAVVNLIFGLVERGPVLIEAGSGQSLQPPDEGLTWLYAPLLAWGPLLTFVTVRYHRRRTGMALPERVKR
jgi:hypothetical protein